MGGLGHDFKAGVNFINEPRLFITFNTGKGVLQLHAPGQRRQRPDLGGARSTTATRRANIPMKQYATYVQDDWRVTDRLTLNLGLRYDLVNGLAVRPVEEPELRDPAEGRRGRRAGRASRASRTSASRREGRHEQLAAARSASSTTSAATARTCSAAAGAVYYRLRLHQLEHPVRGGRTRPASALRHRLHREQPSGHQQPGRQLLQGRPADDQHPVAERSRPARCRSSAQCVDRASSSRTRDQTSFGWSHQLDARHRHRLSTTSTPTARTSTGGRRSTSATATRRARGTTRRCWRHTAPSARRASRSTSATARANTTA